ncbi:TPA: transcriptional regulator [Escherichia coli O156:H25]|nr:transcriptional regulator [Escherichia coli]HDQ6507551.1 transcriptional regulator [Escherichia coli O121:H19]HDQ6566524.1 transcriptional regulator [Escherichia coli O156:H25]EEZ7964216.1 transcriptional regulator [Escherichia coli]EFA0250923.1 transcriptional regulator [Escherichia coli]
MWCSFERQGNLDEEHFRILIDLSPIRSEKVMLALRDYLVHGHSRKDICERYDLNNAYLSISISRITRISRLIYSAIPYYSK